MALGVQPHAKRLELSYRRAGEWRRPSILLERVPCHFGGSRPWFRCPYCEHRRALLYLPPNQTDFRCRACAKLAHGVEAEDAAGRMWRKQRKLMARLGAEDRTDPQPPRPRGMHETTYRRLLQGIWAIEAWGDEQFYLRLSEMR